MRDGLLFDVLWDEILDEWTTVCEYGRECLDKY